MARNTTLIDNRNLLIKKEFEEMYNKKGVRYDWCLAQLSEKFFLAPETIHRILFTKAKNEPKKALPGN